jgi:hypothetical protein
VVGDAKQAAVEHAIDFAADSCHVARTEKPLATAKFGVRET